MEEIHMPNVKYVVENKQGNHNEIDMPDEVYEFFKKKTKYK